MLPSVTLSFKGYVQVRQSANPVCLEVRGLGFRVQGLGFRVLGLGFRVFWFRALTVSGLMVAYATIISSLSPRVPLNNLKKIIHSVLGFS